MKSKTTLVVGALTSIIATVIRLNARGIAWPKNPGWQGIVGSSQLEGSRYYAFQLAIADVSNLFLAFGLVLVAAVIVYELFTDK
jgi:hypothetical protein